MTIHIAEYGHYKKLTEEEIEYVRKIETDPNILSGQELLNAVCDMNGWNREDYQIIGDDEEELLKQVKKELGRL